MDFDWPCNKVWDGYLPPEWRPCPSDDCEHGATLAGAWLRKIARLILMLGEYHADSRHPGHPYLDSVPFRPDKLPEANAVELTTGLAGRPPLLGHHDSLDAWHATKAILRAAGLDEAWGTCPVCKGHAIHPDDIPASETWKETEPPTGDGWQLWETTSEGSPQSPVFATAEELADWCAGNATMFANMRATRAEWLRSIKGDLDADSLLVVKIPADAE